MMNLFGLKNHGLRRWSTVCASESNITSHGDIFMERPDDGNGVGGGPGRGNWIHEGVRMDILRARFFGFGSLPTNTRKYIRVSAKRIHSSIRSLGMMPRLHAWSVLSTLPGLWMLRKALKRFGLFSVD